MHTFHLPARSIHALPPHRLLRRAAIACLGLALLSPSAWAQTVVVQDAWARATVQGQKASGAFMSLTAPAGARLVAVSTPAAAIAEVHTMRMEGDVMKMAALKDGLELPAGTTVELKPGGYHLMLMDLKMPLKKDTSIPLTLVLVDSKGVQSRMDLKVAVTTSAPSRAMHGSSGGTADHSQPMPK